MSISIKQKSTASTNVKRTSDFEAHFLDQLQFKVRSMYLLKRFPKSKRKEINSFLLQMEELTEQNINLLRQYDS